MRTGRIPRKRPARAEQVSATGAAAMAETATKGMSVEMRRCSGECITCAGICTETIAYLLDSGIQQANARLMRLLLDCADICRTSAGFMLRGSELHQRTCAVCAEVCTAGAQACNEYPDDTTLRACAEACLRCASECNRMASPPAHPVSQDKIAADSFPASDPPSTNGEI
jgi:hypothetical protein